MSNNTVVLTSIKGTPLYMAPELVQEFFFFLYVNYNSHLKKKNALRSYSRSLVLRSNNLRAICRTTTILHKQHLLLNLADYQRTSPISRKHDARILEFLKGTIK